MAGPLSSEEIEDVVSSVRRLVSNEQSSRKLSRDLNAERLLLTPALRVVSEASPLAPLILDERVEEQPTSPEPVVEAGPAEDDVDLIEAEWEDELWSEPEVISLGEVALGAEEAEVVLPSADVAEDLVAEAEALPDAWSEVGPDFVEDEPIPFVPLRRRAESLAARLAAGAVTEAERTEAALSTADALPAEVHQDALPEIPEPEVSEAPDVPEAPAEPRLTSGIVDADGTELAVLDEAALQEIVRQMIRHELQGDLGERITRNVRKLVRAEINRALIARDLD